MKNNIFKNPRFIIFSDKIRDYGNSKEISDKHNKKFVCISFFKHDPHTRNIPAGSDSKSSLL